MYLWTSSPVFIIRLVTSPLNPYSIDGAVAVGTSALSKPVFLDRETDPFNQQSVALVAISVISITHDVTEIDITEPRLFPDLVGPFQAPKRGAS